MKKTLSLTLSVLVIATMILAMSVISASAAGVCNHEYTALCDTTCNLCGATVAPRQEHSFGVWYDNGVTADGTSTDRRDCSACGEFEIRSKPSISVTFSPELDLGTGGENVFITTSPDSFVTLDKIEFVGSLDSEYIVLDTTSQPVVAPSTSVISIGGNSVVLFGTLIIGALLILASVVFILKPKSSTGEYTTDDEE